MPKGSKVDTGDHEEDYLSFKPYCLQVGVRKECDSCNEQIPVACKTCPECNHELIPEKKEVPGQVGEAPVQPIDDAVEVNLQETNAV